MEYLDIKSWVESAGNVEQAEFRASVHTLYYAISNSEYLRELMFVKGGLLLALRYKSSRFTMDADFSTYEHADGFDFDKFLNELKARLAEAVELLDYNLDCRIQKHSLNPPGENRNFQTYGINIGYAGKGSRKHKHLIAGNCQSVLKVDFSFNELNSTIDTVYVGNEHNVLRTYSLQDLLAEKYRAIIQQKVRHRSRRQDAYDIFILMSKLDLESCDIKKKILDSLILKSHSRGLMVERKSLRDEEVVRRSRDDYMSLANEIEGELPIFDEVFGRVRDYYEALPWDD